MNLFENLLNMQEVNNAYNKKYSNEEMEILRACYDSPTNEYSYLDFDEWLKELEKVDDGQVLKDILYDESLNSTIKIESNKSYDIRFSFRGNGCCAYNRSEMQYGDYKNLAHISDDGTIKYYDSNLPDDVKNKIEQFANKMKSEYEEKMKNDAEAKRKNDEFLKNRFKSESLSKDTLWTNFNRHYNGFIPLTDLTNYFSLDQFGEFIQWCRKEADLDYDYEKRYSDWSEIYQEINDIWYSEDVESISVENVFNFFTTSDLEEFWDWVEKEYDLVEDELEESTKLEEATSRQTMIQELKDYNIDKEILVDFIFSQLSDDIVKNIYDEFIDYMEFEPVEEAAKIEEATANKSGYTLNFGNWRTGNGKSFASKNELISFLRSNYIDLETVITYCENVTDNFKNCMHKINHSDIANKDASKKLFDRGYVAINETKENDLEEATSGIGAGAYTTKAIDMMPSNLKKVKESLYDEYLEKVMDEKSNVALVNLLHEIRDNKKLSKEDIKKLEDEIRTKVRTIKTEAITEFYGKEWSDEEIQDMINKTKENPGIEMVADPNEVAYPLSYNGKDYWLIGEEKEIVFDGKDCVVVLTVDDNLKRYLTYFEYTLYDDGDGESGPQELKMDVSGVPYKIVEV